MLKDSKVEKWVDQLQELLVETVYSRLDLNPVSKDEFITCIKEAALMPDWAQINEGFYEKLFQKYLQKCNNAGKKLEAKMNA